ncbi:MULTISPECIES: HlyD family secretion protein [unclassified Nitratiruptor]|uniref:HlyD family secretion protein n=1 Tax=unclassified Nitratiruptor TaxID=2624044 RepID=UPI001915794F|nr:MULTISPECIES: HlyD family efflux transporter periplasmic adaptor subunit [unclassified Nitratiruptor]BCD61000.1 membrane fusion protein, multidrug efflux system [Nitratiruptor sp. YY08-10]BCD64932.1 membrane fusion protein, multidrug efflux system [Nitratiruptor sp. YY08-14]
MSKKIGSIIIILLVIVFGWFGFDYLHFRKINAVSDAAFIKSDELVMLGFKVGGKVIQMNKNEHDIVKKGELLAVIDDKDFLKAKQKLQNKKNALQKKIEALQLKKKRLQKNLVLQSKIATQEIVALQKEIEAKKAQLAAFGAKLKKIQKDEKRFKTLLQKRLIAKDRYERVQTQKVAMQKELQAMQKGIAALLIKRKELKERAKIAKNQEKSIFELKKEIESLQKEKDALKSAIDEIELKISYTKLYAPFDGVVAKKFFDAPKVIKKGSPVYAITNPKKLYCEVLLSEKKMHGVKPGNSVKIEVDAIPDRVYTGVVESIAPTSAATFSLVPRDIASGEFTKLDQRFKVRIKLDNIEGLRAGMGATVAIERR